MKPTNPISGIRDSFRNYYGKIEAGNNTPVDNNLDHKEPDEPCTHPLDKRYFSNGGGKCLKCGKIL